MNRYRDPKPDSGVAAVVAGERSDPAVAQALSFQTKVSNLVALGLMLALAAALLLYYYAHALGRSAHGRPPAPLNELKQAEIALPPLGQIDPPRLQGTPVLPAASQTPPITPAAGLGVDARTIPEVERVPLVAASPTPMRILEPGKPNGIAAPPAPSPSVAVPTALQRRLSGESFVSADAPNVAPGPAVAALASPEAWARPVTPRGTPQDGATVPTPLATTAAPASAQLSALLTDPGRSAVSAAFLPSQSLLLPRGNFIDCTLETAIDSSLPGMTTCVTATDTFSADGNVVLLERGTKLIGETRGQVQQGIGRVFVLWTEARTPTGVIVPLDSPGADELGRSGLPGQVERHFWARFGAAILISVIDGAIQAGVQASTSRDGTIIYAPGGGQDVMSEILKSTVAIPPTVIKNNGDRIQVLVVRDVDFGQVYELRAAGHLP